MNLLSFIFGICLHAVALKRSILNAIYVI